MCFTLLFFICVSILTALAEHIINVEDFLAENVTATKTELLDFDIGDFLDQYGYPFESHQITTEDGYILTLHRIANGKNTTVSTFENKSKPAVLLLHGLGSSSVDYFILGPEKSLALMLADQGYDVWLGNNRGNTWSRKHKTLNPDKNTTFWDFSFHELGMYDIPAMIDHVVEYNGNQNISYVGHSQGTTQFFVTASMKPEYNDKINLMVALGPPVYSSNLKNPLVQLIKDHLTFVYLARDLFNLTEILPHSILLSTVAKLVCAESGKYHELCSVLLFAIFGFDSEQLDRSSLPTFFDNFPAGNSMKEIIHLLQEVESGSFRQYDYGLIKNLEMYNQTVPPDYDISFITAPVALYYGMNDWLVSTIDVDRLADELPNVMEKHLIDYPYFNHIDFIIAKDVASILYYDVINMLNNYNGMDRISTPTVTTVTTEATDNGTIVPSITTPSSPTGSLSTTPSSGYSVYSGDIRNVFTFIMLLIAIRLI